MVYEYLNNYKYFKVPAQVVGEQLEKIELKYGEITKENFLNESRSKTSPTHALFEWNDSIAAEKYRLEQAGQVIRMITVSISAADNEEPKTIRAFVNSQPDNITKGRFINILSGMNNEETRRVIIANAMAELKQFEKKYALYTEFTEVITAINKLREVS